MYDAKTNWQLNEVVQPVDMNRIEGGILAVDQRIASGVADISALKNIAAANRVDKMIVLVEAAGLYRFDAESSTAGDDNLVVQPAAGTGRWIKISEITVTHTIDDTQVPASDTGSWKSLFSFIANIIKGITGETSWRTSPANTLKSKMNLPGALATSGVLDWNDVTNSKAGSGYTLLLGNATNGPGPAEYFHALNLEFISKDGSGNITQVAFPYRILSLNSSIYMRCKYMGTWSSWTRMINEQSGVTNFQRYEVQQPKLKDYTETIVSQSGSGSIALNLSNANFFNIVINGATTFSFTNPAVTGQCHSFTLRVRQGGTAYAVTWPASVKWKDSAAPDLSTINSDYDVVFSTIDGGTTWQAGLAAKYPL